MHQRDFAGIGLLRKHALAKKGAVDRHAVQTPRKIAGSIPAFNAVRMPHMMQFDEPFADLLVDPCLGPHRRLRPAGFDHRFE